MLVQLMQGPVFHPSIAKKKENSEKLNPCTLLVGMESCVTIMENNMEFPQNI